MIDAPRLGTVGNVGLTGPRPAKPSTNPVPVIYFFTPAAGVSCRTRRLADVSTERVNQGQSIRTHDMMMLNIGHLCPIPYNIPSTLQRKQLIQSPVNNQHLIFDLGFE